MLGANLLDSISDIKLASSADGVSGGMLAGLAELEVTAHCLSFLPRQGKAHYQAVLAHDIPADWLELYLRENYARVDPGLRRCRREIEPFYHQDAPYDPTLEPRAGEMLQRAREFGFADAVFIPIPTRSGPKGLAWLNGNAMSGLPEWATPVQALTMAAFHQLETLLDVESPTRNRLSEREREVLLWIAAGKSSWEIGEILSISRRTVDWPVERTLDKLGAQTRIQAAVMAAMDGEIDP